MSKRDWKRIEGLFDDYIDGKYDLWVLLQLCKRDIKQLLNREKQKAYKKGIKDERERQIEAVAKLRKDGTL